MRTDRSIASTIVEYGKTILITLLVALLLKLFVVEAYRIPSTSMENTLQIGDFLLVNKLAYSLHTPRHVPLMATSLPSFSIPLFRGVYRGDVIVFEFPGGKDEVKPAKPVNYIKRCIGLPGDTVEIRFGRVYVNRVEMRFPPLGKYTNQAPSTACQQSTELFPTGTTWNDINYGPIVVPKRGDTLNIDPASFYRWHIFIEREEHHVQYHADAIFIDGTATSTYRVQRDYYFVLGDNRDNSMDSRYWGFVPHDHLIGEALAVYWSWDPEVSVTNLSEKLSTIRWKRIGTLIR